MERFATKTDQYENLHRRLRSLFDGERDAIANAANLAALVFELVPDLNWAGFYFLREGELVLGPFQGRTACVRIAVGKGVCGTAVARGESLVVANVHQFDGHIACDAASNAELVIPLESKGHVIGVLDLDSPHPDRFDDDDRVGMESLARLFVESSDLAALRLVSG